MRLANYIRSAQCKTCAWDQTENALQNPVRVSCRQMMIVRVDNYEQVPDTNNGKIGGMNERVERVDR